MKALVSWVNAFGNPGSKKVDEEAVEGFVEGLHACHACDVRIDHPEDPWTFGDLGVGDWFELGGVTYVKEMHYAMSEWGRARDGLGVPEDIGNSTVVEPFDWEWAE